jgi:hypothetical protein
MQQYSHIFRTATTKKRACRVPATRAHAFFTERISLDMARLDERTSCMKTPVRGARIFRRAEIPRCVAHAHTHTHTRTCPSPSSFRLNSSA